MRFGTAGLCAVFVLHGGRKTQSCRSIESFAFEQFEFESTLEILGNHLNKVG